MDGSLKKKGFTIIEIMTYLSISSILMILIITAMINSYKDYRRIYHGVEFLSEINNAFYNLEIILNEDGIRKIFIEENSITIINDLSEKKQKSLIYLDGFKLKITYFEIPSNNKLTTNIIMEGIDEFRVMSKGKNIFIQLENEGDIYDYWI